MSINKDSLVFNRQICPVCKSTDREILLSVKHNIAGFLDFIKYEPYFSKSFYDSYFNGNLGEILYEVAECNNCHFIYLTEVLNDTGMANLYNDWLDKDLLKEYYSTIPYSIYEETMLKVLKKSFYKKSQVNIMDFGAGYGNFCAISCKIGFNTFAFDLSEDKNDHIKNMGVTIINNLENYIGFFDFIYVNQVFEHVSDPGSLLEKLQQCLKKSGYIYLAVPDCSDAKKILKEEGLSKSFFKFLSPHQHINAFTNNTLKLLGTNAGLKALSMWDFLLMFNKSLNLAELKFLIKKTIKNSNFNTGLFFKKK